MLRMQIVAYAVREAALVFYYQYLHAYKTQYTPYYYLKKVD